MTEFIAANIPVAYFEADGSGIEDPIAAAAAYLSWIAFSKRGETRDGARFIEAVRATYYKKNGLHAPADLRGVKRENIDKTIGRAMRRIGTRRWPAKWMAMKMLGCDADYPAPMTIVQAAALLTDPAATKDPEAGAIIDEVDTCNITGRIWYPSLPALAMIMALPAPPAGDKKWWLQSPDWLPGAVKDAQRLAPHLADKFRAKVMFVPRLIALQS